MDNTKKLIDLAAVRGATVDDVEAAHVLLAERILERDPTNTLAREVVQNFGVHLRTGKEPVSFAGFILREPDS